MVATTGQIILSGDAEAYINKPKKNIWHLEHNGSKTILQKCRGILASISLTIAVLTVLPRTRVSCRVNKFGGGDSSKTTTIE